VAQVDDRDMAQVLAALRIDGQPASDEPCWPGWKRATAR
jgi:hypothetical protein